VHDFHPIAGHTLPDVRELSPDCEGGQEEVAAEEELRRFAEVAGAADGDGGDEDDADTPALECESV
jgi:hypothetical protein